MADFQRQGTISITCPNRLTPFLKKEVETLGFPVIKTRSAGLETKGSLSDTMRLNLVLRTAHRIHFLLGEFKARNADEMYGKVNGLPWEEYIEPNGYVSVTSFIDNPSIKNTQFANLTCKDAIVDRMRRETGMRPDSGPDLNHTVVFLFWKGTRCRVFLDTSGESLSRRGYRKNAHTAPMQESLAAAVVQASQWTPDQHFINPMCGSGTLAIEAALLGLNRPAAALRPNFGIKHIKGFNEEAWQQIRQELKQESEKSIPGKIIASDHDPRAIKQARKNAKTAGVDHLIDFEVCDFRETTLPGGNGVVVMNPPYGERIGDEKQLLETYKAIGDFFKQRCTDYTGYVFTGNMELAKHVGLRSSRRIKFYNSTLDCRLLKYELYKGSRK